MKILFDLLLAIPIGLMYSIFFHKLGEILNSEYEFHERIQRNLILSFIGGIIGLILVVLVFGKGKLFYNRSAKFGLLFGSFLLLSHTLIANWNILDNDVKLFSIMTSFVTLLWYSYNYSNESKTEK